MRKTIIILIVIFSIIINANAAEIKGKVFGKDEKGKLIPLPAANIQILGSSKGTLTNNEGVFELSIDNSNKIIISYVGYKKDTLLIQPSKNNYEVVLSQELTLKTIEVTDQKPEGMIDRSNAAKTEIITSKGLLKAACCNLSESFQTNPSVDVTFTDAVTGAKQIQLLGLAQRYTQLLVEKVPNLQGFASAFGLNYIPGPWMNSISISKGAASVTTGYESISGQINVDYREPQLADNFYLNLYANDMQRFESSIVTKYQLTQNLYSASFLHGNIFNKNIDINKDGFADIPKGDQFSILQRFNYDGETYKSKTIFQALYDNRKAGQIDYLDGSNPQDWGTNIKVNRYFFSTKNGFVFPSEKYKSLGTILSFTNHNQISKFGNRIYNAEQNNLFANIIWQSSFDTPASHHETESGYESPEEIEAEKSKHNYVVGISYNYNNYLQTLSDQNLNSYESVPGVFFEYTYAGIHNLTATAGIRADFNNLYGTLITPRMHLMYKFDDFNTIRASIGKGYHNPLPIAENQNILSSSRQIFFDEKIGIEEAWNYGLNSTSELNLFGLYATLNIEYYRTDFINQTIVDMDYQPGEVHFYNLKGKSYSNSFQIDLNIEFTKNLKIITAYRLNDVWLTITDKLQQKPLISPSKYFLNIAYSTENNGWSFDFTTDYNGSGRIPETYKNPEQYRLGSTFPAFVLLHGQITKRISNVEIYLGGENLTDYKQTNPIIAANDPFGKYFDSSMIWGPIDGRKIYLGARLIIN
jgi:outer membrane receptor for ferrienterochelin and colicin